LSNFNLRWIEDSLGSSSEERTLTTKEKLALQRQNNFYESEEAWKFVQAPENQARYEKQREETIKKNTSIVDSGVFVWIETQGTGHTLVSIHKNNKITAFSYGRYDDVDRWQVTGEGVLLKLEGSNALTYLKDELYKKNASVFYIYSASEDKMYEYFDKVWGASSELPDNPNSGELTKKYGKVIDTYDISGNNCTTKVVYALKNTGSKIFQQEMLGFIDYEENFAIPLSLKNYLQEQVSTFEMEVIDVTNSMKEQITNVDKFKVSPLTSREKASSAATTSSANNGESSSGRSPASSGGSL
jgi:hypothetical protein